MTQAAGQPKNRIHRANMNLESYKNLIIGQYEAALCTIATIVNQVPDEIWSGKVANYGFDQSLFHTLFYTDVYLSKNEHLVADQKFHKQHADVFEGYEEFESSPPTKRYSIEFIKQYLDFCVEKSRTAVNAETEKSLAGEAEFSWHTISRGEIHPYNLRHIQHHAAQLIMRLRLDSDINIGWQKSGWDPK